MKFLHLIFIVTLFLLMLYFIAAKPIRPGQQPVGPRVVMPPM